MKQRRALWGRNPTRNNQVRAGEWPVTPWRPPPPGRSFSFIAALPASWSATLRISSFTPSPLPPRVGDRQRRGGHLTPTIMRFAAGVVEVKKWAKTAVERVRGDGWTLPANQSPLSLLVFRIKAGPMPGLASGCRWPEWFADTIPAVRIGRHRAAGHGGLATRRELGKLGRKGRRGPWPVCRGVVVRNRLFTQSDVAALRRLIRCHPSWGRTRLSQEACTLLDWFQPNGRAKERACRVALLKLEALGYLALPPRIIERGGRPPLVRPELAEAVVPESMTTMPDTVEVRLVGTRVESQTWNGLVGKYHYLGLATPVGRFVRYLIYGASRLLGAISFSECAGICKRGMISWLGWASTKMGFVIR